MTVSIVYGKIPAVTQDSSLSLRAKLRCVSACMFDRDCVSLAIHRIQQTMECKLYYSILSSHSLVPAEGYEYYSVQLLEK